MPSPTSPDPARASYPATPQPDPGDAVAAANKPVPTWSPDDEARKSDVTLTRIAPAETNGEYTVLPDASNPAHRPGAAFWESDQLHGTQPATGLDAHEHRS
jgi:hypothetical protein